MMEIWKCGTALFVARDYEKEKNSPGVFGFDRICCDGNIYDSALAIGLFGDCGINENHNILNQASRERKIS